MNTHQQQITTALDDMCAQIRRMEQRQPGVQYSFGDLWAKDKAAREAVTAMAAELEAIGAGGVEQLRKPGCLVRIDEPCQHMQELRAYELTVANRDARIGELEALLNLADARINKLVDAQSAQAAPQAVQPAVPDDIDLPDVEDMAHSAVQEALSFGVSHDVFHRWMRAVMDKTAAALAATQPAAQGD